MKAVILAGGFGTRISEESGHLSNPSVDEMKPTNDRSDTHTFSGSALFYGGRGDVK